MAAWRTVGDGGDGGDIGPNNCGSDDGSALEEAGEGGLAPAEAADGEAEGGASEDAVCAAALPPETAGASNKEKRKLIWSVSADASWNPIFR
ncbi:hypothetical protein [Massilia aerilata]|uniref:Uncharacterized protein n=1 Tax=Massilia aerilata TaxID=453817 RepID=A0ABW0S124_9BURK